jgi:hypothetical protein
LKQKTENRKILKYDKIFLYYIKTLVSIVQWFHGHNFTKTLLKFASINPQFFTFIWSDLSLLSAQQTKGPFGRALASPKTVLALAHEVKPLL